MGRHFVALVKQVGQVDYVAVQLLKVLLPRNCTLVLLANDGIDAVVVQGLLYHPQRATGLVWRSRLKTVVGILNACLCPQVHLMVTHSG